jgi:hypothetical protein
MMDRAEKQLADTKELTKLFCLSFPEMEFWDINMTKRLESLVQCYSQSHLLADFKGNQSSLVLKIHTKNPRNKENSSLFRNSIL